MVNTNLQEGVKVIGLMSGTSLDGLDICYVQFNYDTRWHYNIMQADSVSYPSDLKQKLATAQNMSALDFARLHSDYGLFLGSAVKDFMKRYNAEPDIIASHGHTIFHQPKYRFTCQIGSGAGIAAETGVPTVCDFRTTDVALYGQGAPLVPVGDRGLFADFDYCLNIGGFSNISFDGDKGSRVAFDLSPVNYVLNHYTRSIGLEFDRDGEIAASGTLCLPLLDALNALEFYHLSGPKSLGREWVEKEVIPLIDSYNLPMNNKLATFCEHAAFQIARNVKPRRRVLVTGGGAFNKYLLARMRALAPQTEFCVPDNLTVNFKEALIFAFLGILYICDRNSCLCSVTGALTDNIGGCMYKVGEKNLK